jgi:5-methyltetrahydropteroyltriglutamate--homocysteine methyltransferase
MPRPVTDTLLPITMVGSYPRPLWYDYQLHGRHIMDDFKLEERAQAYKDAVWSVMGDQQRAGLDILTDGQMHFDDYGAVIGSFLWYWYERIPGFEKHRRPNPGLLKAESSDWGEREALTVVGGTAATSKVRPPEGGSGLVEMFQIAQQFADRPLKYSVGALPGNLTFHVNFDVPGSAYSCPQELAEDLAPIFNQELKDLVAAGCEYIQVEDLSAWMLLDGPKNHWVVDIMNAVVDGVDAKLAWHCCLGTAAGNTIHAFEGRIGEVLDYMYEVNVEQYVLDFAVRDMQDIGALRNLPEDKEVAVGVIDVRTLQIETEEQVAGRMRRALEVVPAERLSFTTDCGMKALGRFNAEAKLRTLGGAVRLVRSELGARNTPVGAGVNSA